MAGMANSEIPVVAIGTIKRNTAENEPWQQHPRFQHRRLHSGASALVFNRGHGAQRIRYAARAGVMESKLAEPWRIDPVKSFDNHIAVQSVAKRVLAMLGPTLTPDDTERTIASRAFQLMKSLGVSETWYYDCPAFVLLGSRSCLSISGSHYQPNDEPVGLTNMITVDLSPSLDGIWGDCARSFFIEEGRYVAEPSLPCFRQGMATQLKLHDAMKSSVRPETTFQELFEFSNTMIRSLGFENLDFLGNVGHSIESARADRRYIEAGNSQALGDVRLFTFEPHIRLPDGVWGYKHENIYAFDQNGRAVEI
jgi:Xaa-Pro aminopeptidase